MNYATEQLINSLNARKQSLERSLENCRNEAPDIEDEIADIDFQIQLLRGEF